MNRLIDNIHLERGIYNVAKIQKTWRMLPQMLERRIAAKSVQESIINQNFATNL